ncbi:MAG: hypothetical protein LBB98_02970 [Treponema sp.]|jgi:hypothetical protein|nr:hypothetical protein [Treponema sp.]
MEMNNEQGTSNTGLCSLISLEDFKTILGIDDRENTLSRYCLITATFTIEHYCRRRLVKKTIKEQVPLNTGELLLPLREYPVREVLAVYAMNNGEMLGPDWYRVIPDLEAETGEGPEDTVYSLSLSSALNRGRGFTAIKAVYRAGYGYGEAGDPYGVPADLASACLELAAWNMSRYRDRRIGVTGNVRGSGKDGEHLESAMPENVRGLLEPYRRRVI